MKRTECFQDYHIRGASWALHDFHNAVPGQELLFSYTERALGSWKALTTSRGEGHRNPSGASVPPGPRQPRGEGSPKKLQGLFVAEAAGSNISRLCPSTSALSEEPGREAPSEGAHGCPEASEGRASPRRLLCSPGLPSSAQLPEARVKTSLPCSRSGGRSLELEAEPELSASLKHSASLKGWLYK